MGLWCLSGRTGWASCVGSVMAVLLLLLPATTLPDIGKTKHNLARNGTGGTDTGAENATCVFCHAPVGLIESDASGTLPKWYRSLEGASAFPIYDHIGRAARDGEVAVGSSSMACLSCHDGTQAGNIMKDSYNHPFGVQYRGAVIDVGATGSASVDSSKLPPFPPYSTLKADLYNDFRPAAAGTLDNQLVWWVPAGGVAGMARRTKNDLPLYGHAEAGGKRIPYVECASCHDPHSESRAFLRVGNAGSRLCLTCHDK